MNHTPGLWEYRFATRGSWYIEPKDNPEQTIAVVAKGTVNPDGDGTANARLIAAAPDLLEACKKALFESSLDRSETVLSAEVHEALNSAVLAAEGA